MYSFCFRGCSLPFILLLCAVSFFTHSLPPQINASYTRFYGALTILPLFTLRLLLLLLSGHMKITSKRMEFPQAHQIRNTKGKNRKKCSKTKTHKAANHQPPVYLSQATVPQVVNEFSCIPPHIHTNIDARTRTQSVRSLIMSFLLFIFCVFFKSV